MNAPAKPFSELLDCSDAKHFKVRLSNYNYRADYNLTKIERLIGGSWCQIGDKELDAKPWIRTNLERLTKVAQRRKVAEILHKTNYVDAKTRQRIASRKAAFNYC